MEEDCNLADVANCKRVKKEEATMQFWPLVFTAISNKVSERSKNFMESHSCKTFCHSLNIGCWNNCIGTWPDWDVGLGLLSQCLCFFPSSPKRRVGPKVVGCQVAPAVSEESTLLLLILLFPFGHLVELVFGLPKDLVEISIREIVLQQEERARESQLWLTQRLGHLHSVTSLPHPVRTEPWPQANSSCPALCLHGGKWNVPSQQLFLLPRVPEE